MDHIFWLMASTIFVVVLVVIATMAMARYKRCPSDKVMVIFGKIGHGQTARCIHGGAAFVWPVIQDYAFLDLIPMQIEVDLDNALSKQNIRVSVPSNFTVGISTKPDVMVAAAERLLGMHQDAIKNLARDMIIGQLRLVVATMDIEEINADRDKFLINIYKNVEMELEKIGLRLINVNIKDLQDESGYLSSLGKKAAADALNKAKKDVAEKDRDGAIGEAVARKEQAIGEAEAKKEQTVRVAQAQAQAASGQAEAQQMQRVNVANANARAVEGENKASVDIANSTSDMRQQKAEAERSAAAAEKVKSAQALQESYEAERIAEQKRAERDFASQNADVVVRTRIEKEKKVIEAEAEAARIQKIAEGEASRIRQIAEGEASAIFVKMEAQARGLQEILTKQAQGLERIVKAAGDPDKAATLLIIDKLPELVKTQVEAIKNLKIDKVVVWDNGAGGGKSSTANFLSSLIGSVPPLNNLFNLAGMKLPEVLGKDLKDCAQEKGGEEPHPGRKG